MKLFRTHLCHGLLVDLSVIGAIGTHVYQSFESGNPHDAEISLQATLFSRDLQQIVVTLAEPVRVPWERRHDPHPHQAAAKQRLAALADAWGDYLGEPRASHE